MAKKNVRSPAPQTNTAPGFSEQIVHGLTSGVIAVDGGGVVISVNPAACIHLNISPRRLTPGKMIGSVAGLESFAGIFEELRRTGRPVSRRELVLEDGASERKELGVSASLLDGSREFNGAIFLFTDMTERRRLERASEINRQLAQLGELAAGVVHELRNPLTIISGRAELLLRPMDDEKRLQSVTSILREVKNLETSIAQFLGFARPFKLSISACLPSSVVSRAFQLCEQRAAKKSVVMTYTEREAESEIRADQARLAEALANLVNNAIDEVPDAGSVEVVFDIDGDDVVFEVLDNGRGIHTEPGEDLFSPFLTKKHDGTGLGLSIVQRIVVNHGGRASYGNRDEGGAWFEVRLPINGPQ